MTFKYDYYKMFNFDSIESYFNYHQVDSLDRDIVRPSLENFIISKNKYLEVFGNMQFEEEAFYVNYLSKFKPIKFRHPILSFSQKASNMNFDYSILLMFITASFASDYLIKYSNFEFTHLLKPLPEVKIIVDSGCESESSIVSELTIFQLENLIFIYLSEIWIQEISKHVDDSEIAEIENERIRKVALYNESITTLKKQLEYRNGKWKLEDNINNLFSTIS